ncbi:hypothetical protein IW262DRAFT_1293084 [Armillaria fumosa]|nr:hypothetical protein IW262DRAFT_1293084 [Armillaria fumosa]
MPCHRSCKKFAPRSPPTYGEALHASSSLHLPIGAVQYPTAFSSMPFADLFQFEREYTGAPVPQTSAMIPQTRRFIVPPPYDFDDYIEYNGEETDEDEDDEDDRDDADDDDQEWDVWMPNMGSLVRLVKLYILVLIVWESYFV